LTAQINLNRYITVPKTDSIAKRGRIMKDFMQGMIEEMDTMVMSALDGRMHLLSAQNDASDLGNGHQDNQNAPVGAAAPASAPALPVPSVHPQALPPPW
jgi:hypothetical protein